MVCSFVWGMPSGRTKISPKSRRGPGHVTPTIFGSTVGYPSDSLASCLKLFTQNCSVGSWVPGGRKSIDLIQGIFSKFKVKFGGVVRLARYIWLSYIVRFEFEYIALLLITRWYHGFLAIARLSCQVFPVCTSLCKSIYKFTRVQ